MNVLTPEFIGWAAFALSFGIGLVVLGWYLGLHERDQRLGCELSRERTRAAIAEEMQRRAECHCLEMRDELHVANERIRHLQDSLRHWTLKAVVANSPLERGDGS